MNNGEDAPRVGGTGAHLGSGSVICGCDFAEPDIGGGCEMMDTSYMEGNGFFCHMLLIKLEDSSSRVCGLTSDAKKGGKMRAF
jgi:hypothetical protein